MPVKKYFIAIVIRGELFDRIEYFKHQLFEDHGLKGALRCPSHITLHRPFEWKEEKEIMLFEKLSLFKKTEGAIQLMIDGFDVFEPRVIFVKIQENSVLTEIHDNLALFAKKELKIFNEIDDKRGFHPHITIASRDLKKNKFYEIWSDFKEKPFKHIVDINDFSVLKLDKKWEEIKSFGL